MDPVAARAAFVHALSATDRGDLDLLDRFDRYGDDLITALAEVYPLDQVLAPLLDVMVACHRARDESLRASPGLRGSSRGRRPWRPR